MALPGHAWARATALEVAGRELRAASASSCHLSCSLHPARVWEPCKTEHGQEKNQLNCLGVADSCRSHGPDWCLDKYFIFSHWGDKKMQFFFSLSYSLFYTKSAGSWVCLALFSPGGHRTLVPWSKEDLQVVRIMLQQQHNSPSLMFPSFRS